MSCAECLKPKIGKAHPYFPEEYIYTVGYCLIKYDIMNKIYVNNITLHKRHHIRYKAFNYE